VHDTKPIGQSKAAYKVPNRVTYQQPSLAGKWQGWTQIARYSRVHVIQEMPYSVTI